MICIVSFHMIISIINKQVWNKHMIHTYDTKQAWYKHIIADFYVNNVTLYWPPWHHLDKSSINIPWLICFARNELFILSCISGNLHWCDIASKNLFSQYKSTIVCKWLPEIYWCGRLLSVVPTFITFRFFYHLDVWFHM